MKYYFPTSTLNFDAIASSMCIMPASFYRDGAVGFSRYTRSAVDRDDNSCYLYSRPITWNHSMSDSVDYPMLVEIEDDKLSLIGRKCEMTGDVDVIRITSPYYFTASSIVTRRIRFLFRNQDELKLIVNRTRANVAECKSLGVAEAWGVDNFAVIEGVDKLVDFNTLNGGMMFTQEDGSMCQPGIWSDYVYQDRLDGARVGFRAGQWFRAIITGKFIDTMREPLTFEIWRDSLTPEFNALLDMICGDEKLKWDVNRDAVVDFCARCWKECLAKSHDEARHEILRCIARSIADTRYVYPIDRIQDPEMQALACFVAAGKREGTLVNLLKTEHIQLPELALSLHGALVGYSIMSRALFEKRSYIDEEAKSEDAPMARGAAKQKSPAIDMQGQEASLGIKTQANVSCESSGGDLPGWARQIWENVKGLVSFAKIKGKKRVQVEKALFQALSECKDERALLRVLPGKYQADGWGRRTALYKDLKNSIEVAKAGMPIDGDLFNQSSMLKSFDSRLLIYDQGLMEEIAKRFANIGDERLRLLRDVVRKFVAKYVAGYYGQHPDRYKQENSDLIDHMIKCFISPITPDLNFKFEGDEENSFVAFLEERYHCKRNTH